LNEDFLDMLKALLDEEVDFRLKDLADVEMLDQDE
jgi:hypothetical protein